MDMNARTECHGTPSCSWWDISDLIKAKMIMDHEFRQWIKRTSIWFKQFQLLIIFLLLLLNCHIGFMNSIFKIIITYNFYLSYKKLMQWKHISRLSLHILVINTARKYIRSCFYLCIKLFGIMYVLYHAD